MADRSASATSDGDLSDVGGRSASAMSRVSSCRDICESPLQHKHQHGGPDNLVCGRGRKSTAAAVADDEDEDLSSRRRGASAMSALSRTSSCRDICESPLQHKHQHGAPQISGRRTASGIIAATESDSDEEDNHAGNRGVSSMSAMSRVSSCRDICEVPLQHEHQHGADDRNARKSARRSASAAAQPQVRSRSAESFATDATADTDDERTVRSASAMSRVSSCRDLCEAPLQHKHQHGGPDNLGARRSRSRGASAMSALSRTSSCRDICEAPLQHKHQHGGPDEERYRRSVASRGASVRPLPDDDSPHNTRLSTADDVRSMGSRVSSCRDLCAAPLQHRLQHGNPNDIIKRRQARITLAARRAERMSQMSSSVAV